MTRATMCNVSRALLVAQQAWGLTDPRTDALREELARLRRMRRQALPRGVRAVGDVLRGVRRGDESGDKVGARRPEGGRYR